MKVYLAGGFYQENDWRYKVVKGLEGPIPYVSRGEDQAQKWGALPKAVLDCIDFVGPFPDNELGEMFRCKLAIAESDFVFLWAEASCGADISRMSFELGYAAALNKVIGVGCVNSPDNMFEHIAYVKDSASYSHHLFTYDDPMESIGQCFDYSMTAFSMEKMMFFRRSSAAARNLCGSYLEKSGYVYIIRADTGQYKIGRTNNVPNRMKLFTVKLPFNFEIIHCFPCEDMYETEAWLHDFFAEKRTNGEWFNLSQADADSLKSVHFCIGGSLLDKGELPILKFHPEFEQPWYLSLDTETNHLLTS